MRVGMLAAGVGRRLGDASLPPKVLLRFGGETLLARHAAILRHCGVRRIDLIVGFRAPEIEAEIARIGARDLIFPRFNPEYEEVTGLPWVEIDFPEDLEKAHAEVFSRLEPLPDGSESATLRRGAGA